MTTDNRDYYDSERGVAVYARATELDPAERVLFARFAQDIAALPVLDIGIGAGRTSPHLATLAPGYVGVDYAPAMIAHCRERFADQAEMEFAVVDARRMTAFADGRFQFVMFSFNGIDSVGHDDRLAILGEVHRVLRPGGLFLFSAHNRRYRDIQRRPRFEPTLRPRGIARQAVLWWHSLRNRGREVTTTDYEIVNDVAHYFKSLFYYIDQAAQVRQLKEIGFADVACFDHTGEPLADDAPNSPHLHYAARRAGGGG
jgi:SAM-dependent methyltransferase